MPFPLSMTQCGGRGSKPEQVDKDAEHLSKAHCKHLSKSRTKNTVPHRRKESRCTQLRRRTASTKHTFSTLKPSYTSTFSDLCTLQGGRIQPTQQTAMLRSAHIVLNEARSTSVAKLVCLYHRPDGNVVRQVTHAFFHLVASTPRSTMTLHEVTVECIGKYDLHINFFTACLVIQNRIVICGKFRMFIGIS